MSDKEALKPHLEKFLKIKGVEFGSDGKFLCPFHADENPSMSIVPASNGKTAKCFACGETADIFKVAAHYYGLDEKKDFREIKKRVADELGHIDHEYTLEKSEKPVEPPIFVTLEQSRVIYTGSAVLKLGNYIFQNKEGKKPIRTEEPLVHEAAYPCINEKNEVEFVEIRFPAKCFTNNNKRTCAMWYNGKGLKARGVICGLYGRDLLAQDTENKPVLIVEGPKCQKAALALNSFIPIAWNGGAQGQGRADFTPLAGRRVYVYPDDDEAGGKSARQTAKLLQDIASEIIIIKPLSEAREVKPVGADIVEALQVKTPAEITNYILSHTPLVEALRSNDPYIAHGLFLIEKGFYRIYDKKAISYYSEIEDRVYNYGEIRDKYSEDKIFTGSDKLNPAKGAKMIDNLDPVFPVYNIVKSFGFLPKYKGKDRYKNQFIINRWQGFPYPLPGNSPVDPKIEEDVEFIKTHIKDVVCGGIEEDYEYLCKWIAHMIKKPDEKPGIAIFAQSEAEGTGKSIIFEQLIPAIIGIDTISVFTNKEQIGEKFNSWLFESLYIVFSEQSFYEHTENLKSWITEKYHSRRGMGSESQIEPTYGRFVICTNKEGAYKFSKTERRMFVLNVSEKMVGKYEYFIKLGKKIRSVSVLDRIARFFANIDISNFNPFDIPESQKKKDLIEAEKHPIIDFFERVLYRNIPRCELLVASKVDPGGNNYYDCQKIYEDIKEACANFDNIQFIERDRLYEYWKNNEGRNRRETANSFTRIINKHYGLKPNIDTNNITLIKHQIKENGQSLYAYIYLIKEQFFDI